MPIFFPDVPFSLAYRSAAVFVSLVVLFGLLGCATNKPPLQSGDPVVAAEARDPEQSRWWLLRFRLKRAMDGETNSYLDGLIADQIFSGILDRHATDIELWRFHRRWPRDTTGHQFSFIFFAPLAVAERLTTEVEREPLVARLRSEGHLVAYRMDAADPDRATDLAATSDRSWPPELQREWPKFIMGASRMWLGLVRFEAARHADLDVHARYQAVETQLDALWFSEANHAFFHHLSALFGYKPMQVIRRDIMTF
jgi:hypothetical protein